MSAMANTTPIVTTVTKPATNPGREKTSRDADATPRVNIQDFCEGYYEDILPIIMDKIRSDKRKEIHARLDFGEGSKERRIREGSHYSSARTLSARYHNQSERLKVRDRLRYNDRHESIDSYKDLKAAFLAYFMQQKKYVKDPIEIYNIKQKDEETIEDFMERFKVEIRRMKGAPECIRISGFMHGVNNPKLTKRLNEHVPKTVEEMIITNTAFIRGEATDAGKKKGHTSWRTQDQSKRHTSKKRTPKEILTAEAEKFQPPPPMVTPVEKRSSNKFCDFHNDKGHSTDECMQLKKQIEELVRAGKLSHLIKEIKQGWDQSKVKKKEAPAKDKPMEIYMIQSWQRMIRQKVTQSFKRVREITFHSLATSSRTEGPLVIEAKIGRHMIHHMYVDGGSSTKVLYEHCLNRLWPEVKNQMVPATTSLTGFSGETIWPLGQLRLLETIGDADHSTRAWMNFMIVRSLSPYNGIIGRPGIKEFQAVPSTAHGMLKFLVDGGIITIRSTILIPAECATEVAIRGTLSAKRRTKLCSLLKENLDIFAWQPSDMIGVPRSVAKHRLNIQKGHSPVRQKKRGQAQERAKAIETEIQLAESDEEKTAFHTVQGVYCYTKMPFGLKNAGATYQRLVDKVFDSQIGWNIEVYIDDLVIKSHTEAEMLKDVGEMFRTLRKINMMLNPKKLYIDDLVIKSHTEAEMLRDVGEMFRTLRKINMKLNPKKCTFGAVEGMFLGYMITPKGIKSYPDLTEDVLQLPSPRTIKEVLADFLADMPDKSPPDALVVENQQEPWTLFTDGSSCVDGSGAASNNEAEYEALIAGLRIAAQMGVRNVHVSVDSKLVANQVLGAYVAKEENMIRYLEKVKSLVSGFANFSINQVPRSNNKKADALSKIASTSFAHVSKQVLVEILKEKSIQEKEEASKLGIKGRQYELLEVVLYRRSFLKPWLRCVGPLQADYVIREIHEESCSMHAVKHLQSNGLVERANRILGEGIKARLGEENKNWIEELPHVLWAHRTMIKLSHGDTPFSLTYGTKAVIPVEIGMPTYRTAAVDTVHNDEELRLNLDLLEERRERAAIREAKAKLKMTKYYNARVRGVTFRPGDFVYRCNDASHAVDEVKLGPKWEGPYEVTKALGDGAYKLRSTDGTVLPRTWNFASLKKCYI
nr:hypothetical protein [Tanacetum cinerariifolium]